MKTELMAAREEPVVRARNSLAGPSAATVSPRWTNARKGPVAKSIRSYALATPQADWVEADPEAYWAAVLSGFRETLQAAGVNPREVRSICGSRQGGTHLFPDARDLVRAA